MVQVDYQKPLTKTLLLGLIIYSSKVFSADIQRGENLFAAHCAYCHSIEKPAKNKKGPSLLGIVGRSSGSFPNYAFSVSMQASNLIWTRENLNQYLAQPRAFIPENKMGFKGMKDEKARIELIEYLSLQN